MQSAGTFEIEVQTPQTLQAKVTENKSPAAPPAGFTALETSSFIVELGGDPSVATLQKIDYFLDVASMFCTTESRRFLLTRH
jgi:hypothetical protein